MDPISTNGQTNVNPTAVQQAFANSARSDAQAEAAGSASTQEGEPGSRTTISSDFETFLQMLTVQMENQDPLNPVDSAEYAVQLATFSNVEQQVLTNELLTGLSESLGVSGLNQIAGWVGKRALVDTPVRGGEQPLTVVAEAVNYADRARLKVLGPDEQLLETVPIPPQGGEVVWTPQPGSPANGAMVTFEVESFAAGASLGTAPAQVYAPVREVRMDEGVASVVLPGGTTVPSSRVTALREG